MKVLVALLLCSLAANAVLFVRSRHTPDAPSPASTAVEAGSSDPRAAENRRTIATLFDPAKTDGATLKARLESAGFPPEAVRAAVMAQLLHHSRQRQQAFLGDQTLPPFWETGTTPFLGIGGGKPEIEKELNRLRQEFRTSMRIVFGSDEHLSGEVLASYQQRWGPLPKEKIEAVQRINNDYAELQRELLGNRAPNTVSKEVQEKLGLLHKEQRTDLEATLTPEELFEYDLRASPTATRLRYALQAFDPSEEEYRAIFRAQHARDQASGSDTNTIGVVNLSINQSNEERTAIIQSLTGVLSDQRLADYEFATNPSTGALVRLTNRLGLPIQAARDVTDMRARTMQAIAKIRSDPSLRPEERTSQIAEVARATTEKVTSTLGAEGYQAYLDYGGSWLQSLPAGNAHSAPRTP